MRDTTLLKNSDGLYHGYSKTSEKHLREIFDSLSFVGGEKLLDIGCGKGVVLRIAARYPFERVDGIELDERLVSIAAKNFRILKLEDRVRCFQADASVFDGYGEYNVFFLCNSFSGAIMDPVAERLFAVSARKPITVIYHNPRYLESFEKKGKITVLRWLYDKTKNYKTCIFRIEPERKDK